MNSVRNVTTKPQPEPYVTEETGVEKSESSQLQLVSFKCKNIKTCGPIVHKLLQSNDINLIQEHWLFQTKVHLLGEINEHINYIGKEVDMNDQLLPICMPRGYGGVDMLWKIKNDQMIKPIDLGSERIQCIEIKENSNSNILLTSVYQPAKGRGFTYEDLNVQTGTKRNLYLRDFINECGSKYDKAKTFVNSIGQKSSEIDYFLHNLADQDFQAKQVLNELIENTSDHHPIRMSIKFNYKNAEVDHKQNNSRIKKKVNWDKVDKEWYSAHIDTHIDSLQIKGKYGRNSSRGSYTKIV
ncbi:unnamed protein product [Mytilus coruscus]|uniref:Uncharacterized protein n=1 Tax=Mytilus coruscus TaxID=42192 RepID=A0A6J8A5C3_MYTCO|nr:unnamed protein product [Mytilus coruscus]